MSHQDLSEIPSEAMAAELRRRRDEAERQRQREAREALHRWEAETGIHLYSASDYVGVTIGDLSFYYGYEETTGNEDEGGWRSWCFVARDDGEEVMRIPTADLCPRADGMAEYLLSGIAQYLAKLRRP